MFVALCCSGTPGEPLRTGLDDGLQSASQLSGCPLEINKLLRLWCFGMGLLFCKSGDRRRKLPASHGRLSRYQPQLVCPCYEPCVVHDTYYTSWYVSNWDPEWRLVLRVHSFSCRSKTVFSGAPATAFRTSSGRCSRVTSQA